MNLELTEYQERIALRTYSASVNLGLDKLAALVGASLKNLIAAVFEEEAEMDNLFASVVSIPYDEPELDGDEIEEELDFSAISNAKRIKRELIYRWIEQNDIQAIKSVLAFSDSIHPVFDISVSSKIISEFEAGNYLRLNDSDNSISVL